MESEASPGLKASLLKAYQSDLSSKSAEFLGLKPISMTDHGVLLGAAGRETRPPELAVPGMPTRSICSRNA